MCDSPIHTLSMATADTLAAGFDAMGPLPPPNELVARAEIGPCGLKNVGLGELLRVTAR
jgi:hypothetical protein